MLKSYDNFGLFPAVIEDIIEDLVDRVFLKIIRAGSFLKYSPF